MQKTQQEAFLMFMPFLYCFVDGYEDVVTEISDKTGATTFTACNCSEIKR
ncbi:hypothetical protein C5S31_02440 [ANME-1 cluster archaeon GoMg2]|nr:hypothetical protein [ANME-1 cluster archaeon GoMg2]